jgi:hypothetical protein
MALTTVATANPIKVTGTTSTSEVITANTVSIVGILWFNPTTAAHLMALQHANGQNITEGYCLAGGQPVWQSFARPFLAHGISCDKMESGTLYIYVE